MTLEYVPGEHREPLARLSALLGDCIHPVPLIQVVGLPYSGKSALLTLVIKEKNLPHTTLDCSVFSETRGKRQDVVIKWKWAQFVKKMLQSISHVNPEESKLCLKLRSFEINSPNDVLSLISRVTHFSNQRENEWRGDRNAKHEGMNAHYDEQDECVETPPSGSFREPAASTSSLLNEHHSGDNLEGLKKCLVVILDNYQELLHSEPMLLTSFLRLHERINDPFNHSRLKRKVVVVLVGHYKVPQFLIGSMHVPEVHVEVLQKESCVKILVDEGWERSLEVARKVWQCDQMNGAHNDHSIETISATNDSGAPILPTVGESSSSLDGHLPLRQAWSNYVTYLVGVAYQWYRSDFNSLSFYCRLFWPVYLSHVRGDRKRLEELLVDEKYLATTMDVYIRRITQDYQSRFINDLKGDSMTNIKMGSVATKRHKFHGSRLSKYIVIGAAVAAMCDYKNVKRQLKRTTRRPRAPPSNEVKEPWNSLRNFDTSALVSFTEWVMLTNEGVKVKLDSLFYKQLFWLIQEGFIRPVSSMHNFKNVAVGKSGLLWQKEQEYSVSGTHSTKQGNMHLIQMTRQNIQLSLIAPKEMVLSIAKDLHIDLSSFL